MTNTEWLLLQLIADILVVYLCWLVYPRWREFWYSKISNYGDEHEDTDSARG